MKQPFECRLRAFLEEMEDTEQACNRQEALDLVLSVWIGVHEKYGTPESDLVLLRNLKLCTEHGWHDLDKDPCYMNSPEDSGLRLHLHHDGTIVLQHYVDPSYGIVFTKPGAIALSALA